MFAAPNRWMGLRVLTGEISRLVGAIDQLAVIFHRYEGIDRSNQPRT